MTSKVKSALSDTTDVREPRFRPIRDTRSRPYCGPLGRRLTSNVIAILFAPTNIRDFLSESSSQIDLMVLLFDQDFPKLLGESKFTQRFDPPVRVEFLT